MHTLGYTYVQLNKTKPSCFPNVVTSACIPAALFAILLSYAHILWGYQTSFWPLGLEWFSSWTCHSFPLSL